MLADTISKDEVPQNSQTGMQSKVNQRWIMLGLALATALAMAGYLLLSSRAAGIGFPLDDAWIHQTYARNLAQFGQWAFIPGQPSAGSTAPLWSVLLAVGYLIGLAPYFWTYLLGGICLFALALAGERYLRVMQPEEAHWFPWAGLFLIGEWHLVWASASGMETLLMAFLILWVLAQVARARGRAWVWIGLLVGISIWVRPDGITLLGPAGLTLLLVETSWRKRAEATAWLGGGVTMLFVPYLLFNWMVQGSIWPNTFYAKQAEYAIYRQLPLLGRFFSEVSLPLIGSGLFLLPGLIAFVWDSWNKRRWAALSAVIWFLGYALLYALRLPVIYQYGRYFMPAMPVYFVSGLVGTIWLVKRLRTRRIPWLLARVWLLSGVGIWLAFYGLGATRYAEDVSIIQTEMVAAAKWVAANTPAYALIAGHDIGALGFYGQRNLLDLAGLVSPEVIPFIRDEEKISNWLDQESADYLVVPEDWYTDLPKGKPLIWHSDDQSGPSQKALRILVYKWKP